MKQIAHLSALRPALGGGRGQWGRHLMAILAIALGTALGVAVNLINGAAVDEFSAAVNQFSGQADLTVAAGRDGFSESIYAALANDPDVRVASPVVDGVLPVQCGQGAPRPMRILGVDLFRAGRIAPQDLPGLEVLRQLLAPGQLVLSQSAADQLQCAGGSTVTLLASSSSLPFRVLAVHAVGGTLRDYLLMDIAYAQEVLGQAGRLQRIDLRLREGILPGAVRARLQAGLPAGVQIAPPGDSGQRTATLSRAYRANLTVLALIALFTGAFLVFTTQTLAVARRRARIGLLRALGVERRQILIGIALEGLQLGLIGAVTGIVLGTAVAAWAMQHFGGDLGAGYFSGSHPSFQLNVGVLLSFLVLGSGCAVAGSLWPAWQAAQADPALALHPAQASAPAEHPRNGMGAAVLACGALLCFAPPLFGLPLPGYAAIALLLIGLLILLPGLTARLLGALPLPDAALPGLALIGLRTRAREAALSLATIVVAVSLVAAMLVMVGSFRVSLAAWLDQVLPADLYVRGSGASPGLLSPAVRAQIAGVRAVHAIDAMRTRQILLRPDLPAVALIARNLPLVWSHQGLAVLSGPAALPGAPLPGCDLPCAWVSEAMQDLYGMHPGDRITIPLDGHWLALRVAGIWRDYARQFGAIVIDRQVYQQLTGDDQADDASLYLDPDALAAGALNATANQRGLLEELNATVNESGRFELADPRKIKKVSLEVFDRSFVVTYALEGVALVIGLLGISAGFGAQVLARRREFGVLIHLGASRRQLLALVTCEGLLISAIGVGLGLLNGTLIGVILIRVINRQSFHWSMDTHIPWLALAGLGTLMLLAASATALLSARDSTGPEALLAVREDA